MFLQESTKRNNVNYCIKGDHKTGLVISEAFLVLCYNRISTVDIWIWKGMQTGVVGSDLINECLLFYSWLSKNFVAIQGTSPFPFNIELRLHSTGIWIQDFLTEAIAQFLAFILDFMHASRIGEMTSSCTHKIGSLATSRCEDTKTGAVQPV